MVKLMERAADRFTAWVAPKATAQASCPGAGTTYHQSACVNHHAGYYVCHVAGNCVGICGTTLVVTGSC